MPVQERQVVAQFAGAEMSRKQHVAAHLAVATAAAMVAILAAWVSRGIWRPGQLSVPWGLTLSVGASASAVWWARVTRTSLGFAASAGWIVGMAGVLAGGPGGDHLVIADDLGYGFLLLGTGAVIVTAGWRGKDQ